MQLLSLKLRGAIGIKRGIGLDEISIDFTQFSPGLIALTGRNGSGKTTTMESLHPYRRLASRSGSLQNHFFLKDSHKILTYVFNGDTYESKILIDAFTGGGEAYLFKNGEPLNEGKLGTYDEQIEKLFGSEDLFFNSVFSAQKSKGISELKAAERRELFYELLNLLKYMPYHERAKSLLIAQELRLAAVEGEIKVLRSDIEKFAATKEEIEKLRYYQEGLKTRFSNKENDINVYENKIENLKTNIATTKEKILQNENLSIDLTAKEKEMEDGRRLVEDGKRKVKEDCIKELGEFDAKSTVKIEIKKLEDEKETTIQKSRDDENNLEVEKEKIQVQVQEQVQEQRKKTELIDRNKKILENKDTIDREIKEKQAQSLKAAELKEKENQLLNTKNRLNQEYVKDLKVWQDELPAVAKMNEEAGKLQTQLSRIDNEKDKINTERSGLTKLYEDVKIIDQVPCDQETGSKCLFLTNAYNNKKKIPELEKEYDEKLIQLGKECAGIEAEYKELSDKATLKQTEIDEKITVIKEAYQEADFQTEDDLTKLRVELKDIAGKLVEINKTNWEKLKEEASHAESNIKLLETEVANITQLIAEKEKTIISLSTQKVNIQEQLKDKLFSLEEKIKNLYNNLIRDRNEIANKYSIREQALLKSYEENKVRLEKEIERLKERINPELGIILQNLEAALQKETEKLAEAKIDLESFVKLRNENMLKVAELEKQLIEKAFKEDEIKSKDAEIAFINRDIKEYTFLKNAFDKTGIPVLKLENLGVEITTRANNLLQLFDNKFRIALETTQWTKDKKKLKESFDIAIIDEEGKCEIGLKSGGEKVWIETAITLTIAEMARMQDKNIQTAFLDEKDGPLDQENSHHYIDMILEGHRLSNVHNTLIITQRPELLERIPQQIIFKPGYVKCVNNEMEIAA